MSYFYSKVGCQSMSFFSHNGCRVKIDSLVRVLIDLYQQEAMESAITALQADDSYQDGCLVGANC